MPDNTKPPSENAAGKHELTEEQVLGYLKAHPRILFDNPRFLSEIDPNKGFNSETVVDLQRFAVQRLRLQIDKLKESSQHLVTTTRSNMSILEKTHDCALAVLMAKDFAALGQLLEGEIPLFLGIDASAIGVEVDSRKSHTPEDAESAIRFLTPGTVDMMIGKGHSNRLRTKADGGTVLYGPAEGLVVSDALVRLEPCGAMPLAMLALGSRNEGYFSEDQGTELLGFLAEVMRYAVARWWLAE